MGYYHNLTEDLTITMIEQGRVVVDSSLKELIDYYLFAEQENIRILESALDKEDFSQLKELGDKLYGHGASFGFPFVTKVGKEIELAAKDKDSIMLFSLIQSLKLYLKNVSIDYV